MSNKLPFEDEFKNKMNDLPTGDEDASWQKMKQLLEQKDRRKPFAWLNFYTIGAGAIILACFCFWMIHYNNNSNKVQKNNVAAEKKSSSKNVISNNNKQQKNSSLQTQQLNNTKDTLNHNNKIDVLSTQTKTLVTKIKSNTTIALNKNKSSKMYADNTAQKNKYDYNKKSLLTSQQNSVIINDSINIISKKSAQNNLNSLPDSNSDHSGFINDENIATTELPVISKHDSDKTQAKNINRKNKISIKPAKQFFVEGGLQLKLPVPLAGQKLTAYNYNGNKALLGDYIPSVYIKFEKDKQWFLQSGFSYATPHFIKQFQYSRQTKANYALSTVIATTTSLQKTYYSELPLSFNYYIKPHWSIGAGVEYGWFRGAVAEQETITNDVRTNSYTTAKKMVTFKNFTDSFLYKNQTALLFQTGYSLNRWSFMLRYKKGIQPYIKYTLPNGSTDNKKNAAFEINIGYSLIKKPVHLKKIKSF